MENFTLQKKSRDFRGHGWSEILTEFILPLSLKLILMKILCGTEPFPELYRAKKYKVNDHFFTRKDFNHIMVNLPVQVIIQTYNRLGIEKLCSTSQLNLAFYSTQSQGSKYEVCTQKLGCNAH